MFPCLSQPTRFTLDDSTYRQLIMTSILDVPSEIGVTMLSSLVTCTFLLPSDSDADGEHIRHAPGESEFWIIRVQIVRRLFHEVAEVVDQLGVDPHRDPLSIGVVFDVRSPNRHLLNDPVEDFVRDHT